MSDSRGNSNKFLLKFILFYSLIFCNDISLAIIYNDPIKAFCCIPVADLVGESFAKLNSKIDPLEQFKKITISGEQGPLNCVRIHQILFNEWVQILEEVACEVKVKISTVFYFGIHRTVANCTYWSLKENFFKFIDLNESQRQLIPKPIDFSITTFDHPYEKLITLILPLEDEITKATYSAGTRFLYYGKDNDFYQILIFDPKLKSFVKTKINKNLVFESCKRDIKEKINDFANLLQLWANLDLENKYIPYVWGGASMKNFAKDSNNYILQEGKNCQDNNISYYKHNEFNNTPYTGLDCSGLVARAAQICEIPYFFKNTHTLHPNLQPIAKNEKITNGDLIWFPGHVIIIVDVKNNLCVEARGYSSGFGKIIKLPLNKLFKNINSFDDLTDAYFNKIPLNFMNKNSEIVRVIPEFKILKIESVWYWNKNNS